jgi:hypothetical protein
MINVDENCKELKKDDMKSIVCNNDFKEIMINCIKQILAILFITATLTSCKKSSSDDGYYTITGLVLDWDSKAPIAGAKVYVSAFSITPSLIDSAISDVNGRVSFRYLKTEAGRGLYTDIPGYVYPFYSIIFSVPVNNVNRTDTLFRAKASYLNLNLHQSGIYNATDSMHVKIMGYRKSLFLYGGDPMTKVDIFGIDRRAMAPDSLLHIASVYFNPPYQKAYINWNVTRNGSILSGGSDSTDLNQFGTKNYNLNY